jgi:HrpA-like RNA helicase
MLKKCWCYSELQSGEDVLFWTIIPLHSTITAEEQQRVFCPCISGHRKIILATNIAESSITVTDISYGNAYNVLL